MTPKVIYRLSGQVPQFQQARRPLLEALGCCSPAEGIGPPPRAVWVAEDGTKEDYSPALRYNGIWTRHTFLPSCFSCWNRTVYPVPLPPLYFGST